MTAPTTDEDRARLANAITVIVESLAVQAAAELGRYQTHLSPGALTEAARLLDEAAANVRSLHILVHPT